MSESGRAGDIRGDDVKKNRGGEKTGGTGTSRSLGRFAQDIRLDLP